MCGIAGLVGKTDEKLPVGLLIKTLLEGIQHRGQESAGVTVAMGRNFRTRKAKGTVRAALPNHWAKKRKGRAGIGQVRYSTTGAGVAEDDAKDTELDFGADIDELDEEPNWSLNAQPFFIDLASGSYALSYNGNLTNAVELKKLLLAKGAKFYGNTDTEVILRLITDFIDTEQKKDPHSFSVKPEPHIFKAISQAMSQMKGAFSCLLLSRKGLYAFRDEKGIRPLFIGETEDCVMFTSEPVAWHSVQGKFVRAIEPGEIVYAKIGSSELDSFKTTQNPSLSVCIFCYVYLMAFYDEVVAQIRHGFGQRLFEEHQFPGIVVPIMDSGQGAAYGYHFRQSLKFPGQSFIYPALYKNPMFGRSFLEPLDEDRIKKNKRKFFTLFRSMKDVVNHLAEKPGPIWLIFIDDSLIRGNVSKTLIRQIIRPALKQAYPELYSRIRIAWLLSSPPYAYSCYYGVDTYLRDSLIINACDGDVSRVAKKVGATYLGYLSNQAMLSEAAKVLGYDACDFCDACFTGNYPVPINPEQDKMSLVVS